MTKFFLSAFILFSFTHAAKAAGQMQCPANTECRVAVTGAVFVRDVSNPKLGQAYKDPSGLIWGAVVPDYEPNHMVYADDAEIYCQSIGARLPTAQEFATLSRYFSIDRDGGYNPYQSDGRGEILPGLTGRAFWAQTPQTFFHYMTAMEFYGSSGRLKELDRRSAGESVRCVTRSK